MSFNSRGGINPVSVGLLIAVAMLGARFACAEDWPRWGGRNDRNMVSREPHLASSFVPGQKKTDGSGIDWATTKNVKWVTRLGSETYSTPVVAAGRVFIGTNDRNIGDPKYHSTEGGLLLCLDEATGKILWRLVVPKTLAKHKSSQFDEMDLGICAAPSVEGNRVYLVTNRAEVVCLDLRGMTNGNDGPFRAEDRFSTEPSEKPVRPGPADADILWRYDMIAELNIWPHDATNSAVLMHGDLLYVCTGNGVDGEKSPSPLAPSLIVLDKHTGRLVGHDDEKIGTRKGFVVLAAGKTKAVLGQMRLGTPVWASPVAANGVLFVASFNYLWAVKDSGPAAALTPAGKGSK